MKMMIPTLPPSFFSLPAPFLVGLIGRVYYGFFFFFELVYYGVIITIKLDKLLGLWTAVSQKLKIKEKFSKYPSLFA